MTDRIDPRLAYTLGTGPSPTPGPTPAPEPGPPPPDNSPSPEPSPSPGPRPQPPTPPRKDPDVGVDPSFLRSRAQSCDVAAEMIRMTRGPAKDANDGLGGAASGWSFTKSIDDMQGRWEALVKEVAGRLDRASHNFRLSADIYEENEGNIQSSFVNLYR
jgi:hypothetical protein